MHKVIALIILMLGVAIAGVSQPDPPPPAKAPVQRAFEPPGAGFKALFPAQPRSVSNEIDSSYGKTRVSVHILETSLAEYSVVHTDFPTAIKDKFDLDTRFDNLRDNQVKRMSGRLTEDSEYYFGTNYGRSLVIETAASTMSMRAFVVEQRLFVLSVVTRGKMSTQAASLKEANANRIGRFFDSFQVTSIPKPELSEVKLPGNFGVSIKDSVFRSEFFDLTVSLPENWTVLSTEESETLLELGREGMAKTRPRLAEWMTPETTRILVSASKTPLETGLNTAMFLIAAEKISYPNFLPMAVAQTYAKTFLDPGEKVTKPPSLQTIGGVEFAWVETYEAKSKITQRMYFANRNGIALEFSITYVEPSDLAPMLRAINSLKLGRAK